MAYAEVLMRDKIALCNLVHYLEHSKRPSIDYSETIYGRELIRLDAQQRKIFEDLVKGSDNKYRKNNFKDALSSAGINRQKELKRIEKENEMLQKRIQSARSQNCLLKKRRCKSTGPPINFPIRCFNCKRRPEWNDRW